MTNRAAHLITATLASILVWTIVVYAITADSRQKCNNVASVDVCEWELR